MASKPQMIEISEEYHLQLQVKFRTFSKELKQKLDDLRYDFAQHRGRFAKYGSVRVENEQGFFSKLFGESPDYSYVRTPDTRKVFPVEELSKLRYNDPNLESYMASCDRTPDEISLYVKESEALEKKIECIEKIMIYLENQGEILEMRKDVQKDEWQKKTVSMKERINKLKEMAERVKRNEAIRDNEVAEFEQSFPVDKRSTFENMLIAEYNQYMKGMANVIMSHMPQNKSVQFSGNFSEDVKAIQW